jgi:hypothetical protein
MPSHGFFIIRKFLFKKTTILQLGLVVHRSSTQEAEAGEPKSEAARGYTVRSCLQKEREKYVV